MSDTYVPGPSCGAYRPRPDGTPNTGSLSCTRPADHSEWHESPLGDCWDDTGRGPFTRQKAPRRSRDPGAGS